jgi:parallel beta-helix repeat protein
MYHNGNMAFALEWTCTKNAIRNNTLYDNFGGIWLDWNNTGNIVANNSIFDSYGDGIVLLEDANDNHIANNTIVDNSMNGILCRGYDNEISDNLILRNTHNGVLLVDGGNTIRRNVIQNNSRNGVMMYTFSQHNDYNVISNNSILQNRLYAVNIGTGCAYNTISRNNIINNGEKYQAYDKGENNTFTQNYWNPWNSTDGDGDSFVDYPYVIEGNANNTDRFPLIEICVGLPLGYEFDPNTPAMSIATPPPIDSDLFSTFVGIMVPSSTFIVLLVVLVFWKKRQESLS